MKITRKLARDAKKKLQTAGKRVDHMREVLEGFNYLVDKKAVVFDLPVVHVYRELLGSDLTKAKAWSQNAYLYARLKLGHPKGMPIYIKDIETGEILRDFKL